MFVLSKIAWMLLSPLNFIFILLIGGVIVYWVFQPAGRMMMIAGIVLLALLGGTPLAPNLLAFLETRYTRPSSLPERIDGIIVLGGAFDTELSAIHKCEAATDNIERVAEGVRLAREHQEARLLFTGGEGTLKKSGVTEGVVTRQFLERMGLDDRDIMFEDKSRNTMENVLLSRRLANPGQKEVWVVVTSAYHMSRAMMIFKHTGWGNVIPWPVDYRTDGVIRPVPDGFDVYGNLKAADLALHEAAGMLAFLAGEQWKKSKK